MKKRFLDKVKDNLAVRIWSKKTQQEKGDSQWHDKNKQLFYRDYNDLLYLLDVKVDKLLFRTLTQY
ncbi:hypothetical protein Goklo_005107 [Gossypium klotzschianum]|uniref:Uncharacterized protein n=1 Tax=Gossypium klotzschianum TaxID=34286 RepID=A0A7J8VRG4_9ROSI|nr:hypothetical protein [Gossypium klotzschianum]